MKIVFRGEWAVRVRPLVRKLLILLLLLVLRLVRLNIICTTTLAPRVYYLIQLVSLIVRPHATCVISEGSVCWQLLKAHDGLSAVRHLRQRLLW